MRTYELQKVETYYVQANNLQEAEELVNQLDNSNAARVEIRAVWASGEVER